LKLQPVDSRETFCLFNVYVPVSIGEKRECWDSVRHLLDTENLENIIIAGDLNLTLPMEEKRGGTIVRDPAREWVEDLMQDWITTLIGDDYLYSVATRGTYYPK